MNDLQVRETEAKNIVSQKIKQIEILTGGDKQKASAYGSALMSLASNKGLEKCDIESVLNVGFQIVQAGLNPNPLFNEAYVVPFKGQAQLQVGVKGYITLAYRAGWVVKTRIVYKCDEFTMDMGGFDEDFHHVPNLDKQENTNPAWIFDNIRGVLVMAKDSMGNIFKQFVPNSKIEQIRLKSQNQKNPKAYEYIWKEWTEEMVAGKAVKYVLKRLPISDNIMDMITAEERFETGKTIDSKPVSDKELPPMS